MPLIITHILEITDDGKIAIIQHGAQFHVLVAEDTVNTFGEAVALAEEKHQRFEAAIAEEQHGASSTPTRFQHERD